MKEIHLLDSALINKIAAGEVVERPASVVKELAENSMDAGADRITIEIKDGGAKLIKITDNGSGIPNEQVKVAFKRHATSKITDFEDLSSVLTFGFRGEALAAVSSVSQTEIYTKTEDEEKGTHLKIEGGEVTKEEFAAVNRGTSISVSNIFFNTPARRKFLKKPATESAYISETINRLALGNPHISFTYINNGNELLRTSGDGDLKNTIFYVYGRETASKMLSVCRSKDGYTLSGLAGKPELSRANRNQGFFFINGRYIKSDIVTKAVEEAYKGKMMVGKFPVYMLDLTVPANSVDVNVHPAKLEVRFSNEDFIYEFVKSTVETAFENKILIPEAQPPKDKFEEAVGRKAYKADFQKTLEALLTEEDDEEGLIIVDTKNPLRVNDSAKSASDENLESGGDVGVSETKEYSLFPGEDHSEENISKHSGKANNGAGLEKSNPVVSAQKEVKEDKQTKKEFFRNYRIVGQIFGTYWIIEMNGSMYMIDQHAAHERILYEDLCEKIKNEETASQQLLKPISTRVDAIQDRAIKDNLDLFEKFGFDIEEFGNLTYIIRAVPYVFDEPSSPEFFIEIADMLSQGKKLKSLYDTREDAIATMSCKAAVKGNNKLSASEARELIEKMMKIKDPFSCPHGRPTIVEITKYRIDRLFKRIQD